MRPAACFSAALAALIFCVTAFLPAARCDPQKLMEMVSLCWLCSALADDRQTNSGRIAVCEVH
jgi:hypothetical protein